jgi:PAS domain S-box-containing protein
MLPTETCSAEATPGLVGSPTATVTTTNADELRAIELLRELIDELAETSQLTPALDALLRATLALTQARFGTIHIRTAGELRLVSQIGFRSGTLEALDAILLRNSSTAHRVVQALAPIGIDDLRAGGIRTEALTDGDLGYRASQSVPLFESDAEVAAVITTYFEQPHVATEREIAWTALYGRQVLHVLRQARDYDDIHASERRFRSIFQESNDFIVTADLQQKITYCNPATAAALGWNAEKIVGRSIADFIPAPHFERSSAMLDQKLRAGGSTRYEVDVKTRDGRLMTWEINSRLTFDPEGRPTGLHAIGRDVTTMRRAHEALRISERALREADQRKDEFLAMLAHELRNPLAPIRTAAHVLKRPHTNPSQVAQASAIIERQVEHVTRIVDDLLDVSRVTRGLVTLDLKPTILREVLLTAVEQVRPMIDQQQHRLNVTLPDQRVILSGEAVRLVQMVSNLLSNAARHSGTNGTIDLFVVVHLQLIEIHVRDDGSGIEPDLLPRVFDLFAQGNRSAARSEGGLGIGLALVRRLAELHGGHAEAKSAGRGRGAEFTVVLPRLADAVAEESSSQTTGTQTESYDPLSILVVDDNQDAAMMLVTMLDMDGHTTFVEYDAAAGLIRAKGERPAVLLLDIGLPDMSGYELAQHLRSAPETASSTLIAVTGYGQAEDRRRARAAGFDYHLTKPVSADQLRLVLSAVARASRPVTNNGVA